MPNLRCESHHRICNLRYGTRGYGMSTYRIPSKRLNTSSEDLQGRGIGRLLRGCVPLRKQSGNPFFELADLRPDFLNHAVCFLDITVKLDFLGGYAFLLHLTGGYAHVDGGYLVNAALVKGAHGKHDITVGIAFVGVVNGKVHAHSLRNKLRGTVFPDKPDLFLSG